MELDALFRAFAMSRLVANVLGFGRVFFLSQLLPFCFLPYVTYYFTHCFPAVSTLLSSPMKLFFPFPIFSLRRVQLLFTLHHSLFLFNSLFLLHVYLFSYVITFSRICFTVSVPISSLPHVLSYCTFYFRTFSTLVLPHETVFLFQSNFAPT